VLPLVVEPTGLQSDRVCRSQPGTPHRDDCRATGRKARPVPSGPRHTLSPQVPVFAQPCAQPVRPRHQPCANRV